MARRASVLMVIVLCAAGCGSPTAGPVKAGPVPIEAAGLTNAFRLSDRLYSGSSPEGDAGFASLQALGVKTAISVDGMTPDTATAGRYGLRYVHIPVGYDGIPREKAWLIAKAARDLPGPVYVHCHHGQYRGPAAVACILLALDPTVTRDDAAAWLTQAGIDPHYRGLVELPRTMPRPSAADLDALPANFPPIAVLPDLTRLMVVIDGRSDHLKAAKAAGWATPPGHPDIDPPHEALQLWELFREAGRMPDVTRRGAEFVALLRDAEAAAGALEKALRGNPAAAQAAFERSQAICTRCHAKYRD
ncbi:MAG TPA: hypothetical protein VFG68_23265 [Fimbriiglobus sp.]|nr:hypothetical protein [Fimbriiglobus sp.]